MDIYNIWFTTVFGANIKDAIKIYNINLSPKEIYKNKNDLEKYEVFTQQQIIKAKETDLKEIEKKQKVHIENNIKSINCFDENYPINLLQISDMPIVLYYKGDISLLNADYKVSVIGTRTPNVEGIKLCEDLTKTLTEAGCIIISGIAQGLDGIANKTAIENNGKTVAVTGVSLDKYYPRANMNLQKEIEEKGLVISEYAALDYKKDKFSFVERNRLIAALADAVCLVQARDKSGTMITMNYAIEYSKEVFSIPGSIYDSLMSGNNKLIAGTIVRSTILAHNILEYFNLLDKKENKIKTKNTNSLTNEEKIVLQTLENQAKTTNQIFQETKIPIPMLKAILTKLEMEGFVKMQTAGVYFKI